MYAVHPVYTGFEIVQEIIGTGTVVGPYAGRLFTYVRTKGAF